MQGAYGLISINCPVARIFEVSVAILQFIQCLMGRQCRLKRCELVGPLGIYKLVAECVNQSTVYLPCWMNQWLH